MTKNLQKLMKSQVQKRLDPFIPLAQSAIPVSGWIRTIRDALGMSANALAQKLQSSRANISLIEQREQKETITLATLRQVAEALDCKLVYCLVPNESLDAILNKQARSLIRKKIRSVNYSMQLEEQGLSAKQLKQQEDEMVEELLQGDLKKIWKDDEV